MKPMKLCAILVAMLLSMSASGQITGNKFIEDSDSAYWLGYVSSVADFLYNEGVDDTNGKTRICLPAGGNYGQFVRVVKKYIEDRPERQHEPARFLIMLALIDAFPCPQPTRP